METGKIPEDTSLETIQELRDLARECRDWAARGGEFEREWRTRLADYLERRAVEIEAPLPTDPPMIALQ